jgi:uncharacterized membrane protein YhhN
MFSHQTEATIAGLLCAAAMAAYAATHAPIALLIAVGLAFAALRDLALMMREHGDR